MTVHVTEEEVYSECSLSTNQFRNCGWIVWSFVAGEWRGRKYITVPETGDESGVCVLGLSGVQHRGRLVLLEFME